MQSKGFLTALHRANLRFMRSEYSRAIVGRQNQDGSWTVPVEGNAKRWYVTLEDSTTVLQAAPRGAAQIAKLPVLLKKDWFSRKYYIDSPDTERAEQFMGDRPLAFAGPHQHDRFSGNPIVISLLQIQEGFVSVVSGLIIRIEPFIYPSGSGQEFYPGGQLDLTPYLPTSAGTWAWAKIGVNPNTNLATAIAGTAQSQTLPLLGTQLAGIAFGGNIPRVGLKLRAGQTAISNPQDLMDCSGIAGGSGGGPSNSIDNILVSVGGEVLASITGYVLVGQGTT